jgi:hypothetical protein
MKPEIDGGDATTFEVLPLLPAGIQLDAATGAITGMLQPGVIVEETVYVVTARNNAGEASTELVFCVSDPPPVGLAYPDALEELVAGQVVNWTPQFTGGYPTGWSVAPALPTGLNLDGVSGVIRGAAAQAFAGAAYQIVASNTGGQTSVSLTVLVRLAVPRAPLYPDVPEGGLVLALRGNVELAPEAAGPGCEFTVRPDLPPGLALDEETGVISGQPSEATEMKDPASRTSGWLRRSRWGTSSAGKRKRPLANSWRRTP